MILVVDSGSTKTDWIAVDANGETIFSTQTLGLNPQVLSSAILLLLDHLEVIDELSHVTEAHYSHFFAVDAQFRTLDLEKLFRHR